jgi:hypothetical protein
VDCECATQRRLCPLPGRNARRDRVRDDGLVAILRTRVLPRMLGLLGFPVAASLVAARYCLPLFALLGWVLAASLLLCFREGAAGED